MRNPIYKKIIKNPFYLPWKIKTKFLKDKNSFFRKLFFDIKPEPSGTGNSVMFHIGRSGSTLLDNMLSQHPFIYWDGELLKNLNPSITNAESPLNKIRLSMQQAGKYHFYGFEVKFFHLNNLNMSLSIFLEQVYKLGFEHFIVLQRKNYLRKIVSSLKASKTGEWHKPKQGKPLEEKISITPEKVLIDKANMSLIAHITNYDASFKELKLCLNNYNHLWLTYEEDILIDPQIAYNKILDFFNLKKLSAKINYGRTNPFHLSQIISNYHEIEECIRGTEFNWMLSD